MRPFVSTFLILAWITLVSCKESKLQEACGLCETTEAKWIQVEKELPESDSLFYLSNPAPLFRKEFRLEANMDSAKLFITSAGYYKATINGEAIGKNILDPAWTDYSKRIYYSEYDLTEQIQQGDNCLGVTVGNGFYNPLPLRKWGRRNLREDLTVGKPTFIASLVVYLTDGSTREISTDETWKYTEGPLLKNSVYIGVAYDQRRVIAGWDRPGFDDTAWNAAQVGEGPGGKLQAAFFPGVQVREEIKPKSVSSNQAGLYMVDMGVNFTGTYKIRLSGSAGDTVTLRFGERLYDDGSLNPMTTVVGQIKRKGVGGPGAPDIAWQTSSYILGDAPTWFSPDFTYHTFRYMEISGLKEPPQLTDIVGLYVHTNVAKKSHFNSSNSLLNDIQQATERTFLSNLVSVQSDCAVREKFGYGGDLNATNESFIYNFDMRDFYRKTVYDWVDAMNDSIFVDTAPFAGIKYCGISWESAYLITQYYLYLYYNDTSLVEELYDLNLKWMDKVARIHPNGLVDSGLSDHESLEPVPVQLTGTAHYLQCAEIMETFASLTGDTENVQRFKELADKLRRLIKAEFWDQPVKETINKQTLFSTLLYHGIIPDAELPGARDSLLLAVKNGPSGHFNTGIFGTKYVLETLSENAPIDQVYAIVNSTQYPGWGHMIDRGATTIWETWKESDNVFTNCHPMFGTVTEWFYRWLGGIRPDPANPGFKEFVLAPKVPAGLDSVTCSYRSPYGTIVSNWKRVSENTLEYEMIIPEGSVAQVSLAIDSTQKLSIVKNGQPHRINDGRESDASNFRLSEGRYRMTVSP